MRETRTVDGSPGPRGPRGSGDTGRSISARLTAVALAIGLSQLFVLPLVLLPRDTAWGWLLVPIGLATTPFWSLIHEAIHGSLIRRRTVNDYCGRALAILYGSPFALLKIGHLLHHRYNRTRERTEVYDPATTSRRSAAAGYYPRLLGGLYLLEVAALALALLPAAAVRAFGRRVEEPDSIAGMVFERLARDRVLPEFRVDAAAVLVLHVAAFLAYGPHGWMLAAALFARALIISFSDNSYHYGTALDAPLEALDLRLPRALEGFALSFNLHGVHHRHPGLRWYELRRVFDREGARYDDGWFGAAARQLRGPVPLEPASDGAGRA
ncbi:fatty acid desaturase family protein [Nocardia bovistercoris]|uniref:Fatty acid desaturase n=1 Tax=Nocardia bovistercoris TaxID=2785916 RepID=A0A931IHN3_9NOCA|nr:fatty acid desaturase [Nocardia bovistercoris]MBH0779890.1 fatty acid desaturase [Nocardia bovistercoris]